MLIGAHKCSFVFVGAHKCLLVFSGTVFFSSGGARLPVVIVCLAPPGNDKAKKMVRQKQTSINFGKKRKYFQKKIS